MLASSPRGREPNGERLRLDPDEWQAPVDTAIARREEVVQPDREPRPLDTEAVDEHRQVVPDDLGLLDQQLPPLLMVELPQLLVVEPVELFVAVFEVVEPTFVRVAAEEGPLVGAGIPTESLQEGLEVVGLVGDVLH